MIFTDSIAKIKIRQDFRGQTLRSYPWKSAAFFVFDGDPSSIRMNVPLRSMGILLLQIRHARLGNSIGGSQEPHDFLSVAVNWS